MIADRSGINDVVGVPPSGTDARRATRGRVWPSAEGRAPTTTAKRGAARRRALKVTAGITVLSLGLLVDLLLVGHTTGEEIWGPVTAAFGSVVGALSLLFLAVRGKSRAARVALYALWLTVAFFGFGGYNDHRLPRVADTITDQRERPPLAPLTFTAMGLVGAIVLRSGSKGE